MTKQKLSVLKGWGIGLGVAIALGTVGFLSSASTTEEKAIEGLYVEEVIMYNDTSMFEYPTIFDASVITSIPFDEVKDAIQYKHEIDGYKFRLKRD